MKDFSIEVKVNDEFIQNMKNQKRTLLALLSVLEDTNKLPSFVNNDLTGLINMIDSMQDTMVDDHGAEENKVFNLHPNGSEVDPEFHGYYTELRNMLEKS